MPTLMNLDLGKHFWAFTLLMLSIVILVHSINEEGAVLLEFKLSLADPSSNLHNWNPSDSFPCAWIGIGCTDDHKVNSINLHGLNLSGSLSSTICKLSFLTELNMSKNFISGSIPKGLASCQHLEVLDLCTNRFRDDFPTQICTISSLKVLSLCENYIGGQIPDDIGKLILLEELVVYSNNLTGMIPKSIGRLKQLKIIRAGVNSLSGPIPSEVGECENLQVFGLAQNNLDGPFPRELQKIKNLSSLVLWQNLLSGKIPPEIGNFSSLELLALHANSFSGSIPEEIGKLTQLKKLYLYTNQLNGTIPQELGNCLKLVEIDLSENHLTGLFDNHLEGSIPPLIGASSNLSVLDISMNNLVGTIPPHLCKFQKLMFLSLGSNKLSGNIPRDLKSCKSLIQLMLGDNLLTGSLPLEFSNLYNLSALELHRNHFTGPLPSEIGQLKNLKRLHLSDNYFFGHIPPEIGNLVQLVTFNVSSNQLFGDIPQELMNCLNLQRLDLSRNWFTGQVPSEVGNLVNLELLKLSDNRMNGPIPTSLGKLARLTELQMGGNFFSGNVPFELGQLTALQISLNISHNSLSGTIPQNLGNLLMLESLYLNDNLLDGEIPASIGQLVSLLVCNLSNNGLFGAVPNTPIFRRMDPSNFAGNHGLCILDSNSNHCQPPSIPRSSQHSGWFKDRFSKDKVVSIVSATVGFFSLIFAMGVCWAIKHRKPVCVPFEEDHIKPDVLDNYYFPKAGFRYQDLVEATHNFSEDVVIGKGACGVVYKAIMANGEVVAVKKLKSSGGGADVDRSFLAEISTLGKIRHKNIVKLYGFCYHQESNLLLYEYMENGSLGELLHGQNHAHFLDWDARYKIAHGAAEGLCYLHNDCRPHIIHRDIKSNNILLDKVLQPHVGDFGLAKLMDFSCSKSMSAVAGSYGYIAPEYAYTMKVTEKCDIYSFGVVLLELVTGRPPVQPLDQGGDLVTCVRRSIHGMVPVLDLYDKRLDLSCKRTTDEMSLFLRIALFCTSPSPLNRPTMREVVAMMIDAKEVTSNSLSSPSSETPLDDANSCKEPAEMGTSPWQSSSSLRHLDYLSK
ncbi:Concanavalin A-like lectin/glucanase, subgroup [Cynara cardunculus var. scolymus]|uniref:non-specific serine/threonine protein kinase n=1 Tax=Cynara cardunculus var. scolymus TaxID=59895 RepID=A0A103XLZ5_CYNCS|nr:Concanavalin A-like lectin/glucanase, subgroup [Cynara cardunculus var. scolymus]